MKMCTNCGGAIFGANEVSGYAGPICGCVWRSSAPPYQLPTQQITIEDIKRAIREVLNEKEIK